MSPTARPKNNRRAIAIVAGLIAAAAIIALAVVIKTQIIDPGNSTPVGSGQPVAPTLALPIKPAASPVSDAQLVSYIRPVVAQAAATGTPAPLYVSCTVLRGATPTPTGAASAATAAATTGAIDAAATAAATAVATDYSVFNIAGAESEACYEVGETLPGQGKPFNLAIGVSKAIAGQIAIDKKNLASSLIGQIVIDISQFTSDSGMRDGQLRKRFLESNTYPTAKLTPTSLVGLPARAYVPGETLTFQIVGTLNLHNTDQPITFNVTAHLTDDNTLVGAATANIKMTDFGITVPDIGGFVKSNNDVYFVLNLVAHPAAS
jgi:polyisoprenoid-binding protein YceI